VTVASIPSFFLFQRCVPFPADVEIGWGKIVYVSLPLPSLSLLVLRCEWYRLPYSNWIGQGREGVVFPFLSFFPEFSRRVVFRLPSLLQQAPGIPFFAPFRAGRRCGIKGLLHGYVNRNVVSLSLARRTPLPSSLMARRAVHVSNFFFFFPLFFHIVIATHFSSGSLQKETENDKSSFFLFPSLAEKGVGRVRQFPLIMCEFFGRGGSRFSCEMESPPLLFLIIAFFSALRGLE